MLPVADTNGAHKTSATVRCRPLKVEVFPHPKPSDDPDSFPPPPPKCTYFSGCSYSPDLVFLSSDFGWESSTLHWDLSSRFLSWEHVWERNIEQLLAWVSVSPKFEAISYRAHITGCRGQSYLSFRYSEECFYWHPVQDILLVLCCILHILFNSCLPRILLRGVGRRCVENKQEMHLEEVNIATNRTNFQVLYAEWLKSH